MVVAEVLYYAVEVFPVENDLVLGQRDCQDLVAGFLPPLPAIKPGERKPIGRAVESGSGCGVGRRTGSNPDRTKPKGRWLDRRRRMREMCRDSSRWPWWCD